MGGEESRGKGKGRERKGTGAEKDHTGTSFPPLRALHIGGK